MNEKLTEQYYRTDFETSKLLKEAGFDEKCTAHYDISDGYYWGIATNSNHNYFERKCSAPLISVAKEWLNEKGYYTENISVYKLYKREPIGTIELDTENARQYDLDFIQTCCKHIIENK